MGQPAASQVAHIMFVAPELAMNKTFAAFLDRLQGIHHLNRININECHTVLDASARFCPKMLTMGHWTRRKVPMLY